MPSPSNPQSLNRYSYVMNNPLRYNDPSGHRACGDGEDADCNGHKQDPNKNPHPYTPKTKPHKESTSNKPAVELLRNASTMLDAAAWSIDLFDVGVVVAGGIFGAGVGLPFTEGGPEVPVVTGLAGMGIAELYVQAPMQVANVLSTVSTGFTAVADVLAGDTNLMKGVIAKNTLNSVNTTVLGWGDPEAITGFAMQSLAVSNDLGWSSFPFH